MLGKNREQLRPWLDGVELVLLSSFFFSRMEDVSHRLGTVQSKVSTCVCWSAITKKKKHDWMIHEQGFLVRWLAAPLVRGTRDLLL